MLNDTDPRKYLFILERLGDQKFEVRRRDYWLADSTNATSFCAIHFQRGQGYYVSMVEMRRGKRPCYELTNGGRTLTSAITEAEKWAREYISEKSGADSPAYLDKTKSRRGKLVKIARE